jgi:ribosomal protein S18 acetylase RimI-like enzyme
MTAFPLVTRELARRIVDDYGDDRIRMFQEIPGNPYDIDIQHFGRVRATFSNDLRYNAIFGLGCGDEELLDKLVLVYRERKREINIWLEPGFLDDSLAQRLTAHGMYQSGFLPVLYGIPQPLDQQPEPIQDAKGVTAEEVREQDMDLFLSVMREGIQVREDFPEYLHGRRWFSRPGWHPYLARVEGVPAGVGMLYVRNGTAYLTFASTLPAFRRRGCQTALLRHRIAGAHALGCDLLTSSAAFDSVSQHNLERSGLRIAYTLATWRPLPSP